MRRRLHHSYARREMRRVWRLFVRENWRLLGESAAILLGLALVEILVPIPKQSDFGRGFVVGALCMGYAALLLVIFLNPDDGNYPRLWGAWAEDHTSEILRKSRHVIGHIDRVELAGYDVDHVAVTPSAVIALETKRLREWRGLADAVRAKHLEQARRGASTTRSLLRSSTVAGLPDLPVEAVLVLWGDAVDDLSEGPVQAGDLTVIRARDLEGWLAAHGTGPIGVDVAERALSGLNAYATRRDEYRERQAKVGRREKSSK